MKSTPPPDSEEPLFYTEEEARCLAGPPWWVWGLLFFCIGYAIYLSFR